MTSPIIIDLIGQPSAGKSSTAAGLFYRLKLMGCVCELVPEYAKDLVWSRREHQLADQLYVFAKQRDRLERLRGQVHYVVTDSPLRLSHFYGAHFCERYPSFSALVKEVDASFTHASVFLRRTKPYSAVGRTQTQSQADAVGVRLAELFVDRCELDLPGDEAAIDHIINHLTRTGRLYHPDHLLVRELRELRVTLSSPVITWGYLVAGGYHHDRLLAAVAAIGLRYADCPLTLGVTPYGLALTIHFARGDQRYGEALNCNELPEIEAFTDDYDLWIEPQVLND